MNVKKLKIFNKIFHQYYEKFYCNEIFIITGDSPSITLESLIFFPSEKFPLNEGISFYGSLVECGARVIGNVVMNQPSCMSRVFKGFSDLFYL